MHRAKLQLKIIWLNPLYNFTSQFKIRFYLLRKRTIRTLYRGPTRATPSRSRTSTNCATKFSRFSLSQRATSNLSNRYVSFLYLRILIRWSNSSKLKILTTNGLGLMWLGESLIELRSRLCKWYCVWTDLAINQCEGYLVERGPIEVYVR